MAMNWLQLISPQIEGKKKSKLDEARSAFERDFDRIIFSQPFRRLQDKTQVFPVPDHDFVHTRLTHSLEVSSVARSLGKNAGKVIIERHGELSENGISEFDLGAITAAAALAHDMGNPPFGHSGEKAISNFFLEHETGKLIQNSVSDKEWSDLSNFEGNAMGFRLMNKQGYQGLNLTYATQAAFTKYPVESLIEKRESRKSQKKYGFFQSEKEQFKNIAQEVGLLSLGGPDDLAWCRHPLAFLVEAADDICYHIIDLEDGCRMGLVPYTVARDLLAPIIGKDYQPEKLERVDSDFEKIGMLRAMAIGKLIFETIEVYLDNEPDTLNGKFDSDLVKHIPSKNHMDEIMELSIRDIYRSRLVLEKEVAGFEVISGLFESFLTASYHLHHDQSSHKHKSILRLLPVEFQNSVKNSDNIYEVSMSVIDFISGMTDRYALSIYRKIKGISLPGTY